MLVEIGERNIGALPSKQHRDRATNAGIAAGDKRGHIEELIRALVAWRIVHRLEIEVGFAAGLFQVLARKRRYRVDSRPRLHGMRLLFRGLPLFVGSIDLALDGAFAARGAPGLS